MLVLLPDDMHKLLVCWQGPFWVIRKVAPVNYEVLRTEPKLRKKIYHINLLKKWHPQERGLMQKDGDLEGPELSPEVGRHPVVEGMLEETNRRDWRK